MTLERLEESAAWADGDAERSREQGRPDVAAIYADLARCARFAAEMERAMQSSSTVITLMGFREKPFSWSYYPGGILGLDRVIGRTAIEAVERAGGGK